MAGDHMWVLDGWTPVDCAASDEIRATNGGISSLSAPDSPFGLPVIYVEWAGADGEVILRDYADPAHVEPCRHYVPGGDR